MGFVLTKKKVFIRALCWLLFLAPFFYLSYGFANHVTNLQPFVPEIYYHWEKNIPFLGWTIIPYWCLNLFYGLSLLLPKDKNGVDRLAGRYFTAQIIAVTFFLIFPLKATFIKPETFGFVGYLFMKLGAFDLPFNQAPSLHIALVTIIWDLWRKHIKQPYLLLWHGFCLLIVLSVLTTYQHHFIDIPTGFLLGVFCLWLFPEQGVLPFKGFQLTSELLTQLLALGYCFIAFFFLLISCVFFNHGIGLIFLWPMICFFCVASGYLGAGAKIFQKDENGSVSFASWVVFAPYRLCAFINSRFWTRTIAPYHFITNNIYLGRFPSFKEAQSFDVIIDMTAEFIGYKKSKNWYSFPMLDLIIPDEKMVQQALKIIEKNKDKRILVCCALGFQRSANILIRYLVENKHEMDVNAAKNYIQIRRPIVIHDVPKNFLFFQAALYCFLQLALAACVVIFFSIYVVYASRFFSVTNVFIFVPLGLMSGYGLLLMLHLLFDAWLFWCQRNVKNVQEGLTAIDNFLTHWHLRKKLPSIDIAVRMKHIREIIKRLWITILMIILSVCFIMFFINLMDVLR